MATKLRAMSAALAIDDYVIEAPSVELPDPAVELANISVGAENARKSLSAQRKKFEELHRDAGRLSPGELELAQQALLDRERQLSEILLPRIQDSERRLADHARRRPPNTPTQQAIVRLLTEAHEIGCTWLELYQDLRIRLAKLASDKLAAEGNAGSPIISSSDELIRHLRSIAPEDR